MTRITRLAAPVAMAAMVAHAACGRDDAGNSALNQDTTLARDLARAGVDSAAQPQLKDVPEPAEQPAAAPARPRPPATRPKSEAPAPRTEPAPKAEPAPAPGTTVTKSAPGSEPAVGAIPAGTTLALSAVDKVCTNTNKVGDRFTATLDHEVTGSNGVSIPAGSKVTVEITELHKSENVNDKIVMGFRVVSLTVGNRSYYPDAEVVSAEIDRVRASSTGNDAKKVLGGAVAGAIIGQVIGKDRKGTLIGAAAGAAAGGAAAAATADYNGCVDTGSAITVKLNTALSVTAAS